MDAVAVTAGFREFARILGCQPGYVTKLRKAGRLVLTENGKRVCVAASRERIQATRDPAKAGVVARHAAERAEKRAQGNGAEKPTPPSTEGGNGDGRDQESSDWVPPDDSSHAMRRAKALADKEEQLAARAKRENLVEMGKLLDAAEVEHALFAAGTTLRTALENMPDTLAPELAAAADEAKVRVILGDALEHALAEIARNFSAISKSEDAA